MNAAIDRLNALGPTLRAEGLSALYLFGSAARDDAHPDSDIDLLFEVESGRKFSLIDQAQLQIMLSEELGRNIDFIERAGLRPSVRKRVESEMVRIF